jgi:hypothetical protein
MQSADPNAGAARSARGPLSPAVAFLLLLAVIAVVGTILLLTRPEAPPASAPNPTTNQEPTFTLTNEEAITRFEELDRLRLELYERVDESLVPVVFTPSSPIATTVRREIRQLARDNIRVRTIFETRRIDVIANGAAEIELEQEVVVEARFLSTNGEDITSGRPELQVVRWTLQKIDGTWLLHDAVIKKAKTLRA